MDIAAIKAEAREAALREAVASINSQLPEYGAGEPQDKADELIDETVRVCSKRIADLISETPAEPDTPEPAPMGVKVKPLDWEWIGEETRTYCDGALKFMRVTGTPKWIFISHGSETWFFDEEHRDKAIEYAENIYQTYVLSLIEATPITPEQAARVLADCPESMERAGIAVRQAFDANEDHVDMFHAALRAIAGEGGDG